MDWEDLEALYWQFDAMHRGYGAWEGRPTSERDAFKRTVKQALAEKDQEIAELKSTIHEWEITDLGSSHVANREEISRLLLRLANENAKCAEKDREIEYLQECRISAAAMDSQRVIEYQQLMEKAVRFGKALTCEEDQGIAVCIAASDFLQSPEVQAWKEQP